MFSELLDGRTITVTSPDSKVSWELEDGRKVEMWFRNGPCDHRRYTEPELERQLAGLLASAWNAHRQAHLMALSDLVGHTVSGNGPQDRKSREFGAERAKVVATGESASARIRLVAVG